MKLTGQLLETVSVLLDPILSQRKCMVPLPMDVNANPQAKATLPVAELQKSGAGDYFVTNIPETHYQLHGLYIFVVPVATPYKVLLGCPRFIQAGVLQHSLLPVDKEAPSSLKIDGHASLAMHQDVFFAGEVIFANNRLVQWGNSSGHYKPPTDLMSVNLLPMVKRLLPEANFVPKVAEFMLPAPSRVTPMFNDRAAFVSSRLETISQGLHSIASVSMHPAEMCPAVMPKVPISSVKMSSVKMSSVNMPSVNMLSVNMPSVNTPSVNAPSVNMSSVKMFSVNMPSVNMLSVNTPSVNMSSVNMSSVKMPSVNMSSVKMPSSESGFSIGFPQIPMTTAEMVMASNVTAAMTAQSVSRRHRADSGSGYACSASSEGSRHSRQSRTSSCSYHTDSSYITSCIDCPYTDSSYIESQSDEEPFNLAIEHTESESVIEPLVLSDSPPDLDA